MTRRWAAPGSVLHFGDKEQLTRADHLPGVLADGKSGGCWDEITRHLGYRFTSEKAATPTQRRQEGLSRSGPASRTTAWPRPSIRVTSNWCCATTPPGKNHPLALDSDPRTWEPGTTTLDETVNLPAGLARGTCSLFLNLPDPRLHDRADHAIRLADEDTWEASSGMNDLLHKVTVNRPSGRPAN